MAKPYFMFTGNPIIDNGIAVLANIAGKDDFEDIIPNDIKKNIHPFFESIKYQYDDENAAKKEKKYSKRKLKQHLALLYTTNHYLHGVNNYVCWGYLVKIVSTNCDKLWKLIPENIEIFSVDKSKIEKNTFIIKFNSNGFIESPNIESIEKLIEKNFTNVDSKWKTSEVKEIKKKVDTNEEYFASFEEEIKNVLSKTSKIFINERRVEKNNICNFCGRQSDIRLSKDIFPLSSPMDDLNLGVVHICNYCYLASLFSFFNFINFKKDENSSGMYFFYHFSNPKVMIEYSKQQIKRLQNEKLASLQTIIGGKYSSAFNDLYEKINSLKSIKEYHPSVTIYFLLNDNRGAIYENFSIPYGLLNFWFTLQTPNGQGEWSKIHSNIKSREDYHDFVNGDFSVWKVDDIKKETVISYLKEVILMNDNLIKACEELSKNLKNYFEMLHQNNLSRRQNWTQEFYDSFRLKKPYEFFYNLFQINNDYFRWTGGTNLLSSSSMKEIIVSSKKYNLLYGFVEYLILNEMNEDEKTQYFDYYKTKTNK